LSDAFDIAIIGAGIAGASIAAELGPHARVALLEAEDQPGYHSTGRSAAFWAQTYGGPRIQPLTSASGSWLDAHGFFGPRGALNIARAGQEDRVEAMLRDFAAAGVRIERMDRKALEARLPGLLPEWQSGAWEPDCRDIDVAAVLAHYLGAARRAGVALFTRTPVSRIEWNGHWHITAQSGAEFAAALIVNAAGAWADEVARIAGIAPLGLQPMRRTIAQLRTQPAAPTDLPLVIDIEGSFYFKPENGRLWLSPHDETPTPPCDAAPEEIDVALAIDRMQHVIDWTVERVEHRWAGLRTFAPDRLPVYGRDPARPEFAWFAGQGGFGIQTAPAAARLTAQRLLGHAPDEMTEAIDPEAYDPARFL
jgi:D-arginine dehydrogenase